MRVWGLELEVEIGIVLHDGDNIRSLFNLLEKKKGKVS